VTALDAVYIPQICSLELLGLQSYFLETVKAGRSAPVLLTYGLAGKTVSLGRYHLYSGPDSHQGINVYRRLTGGRITGAGDGWLGCVLILPSRDALAPQKIPGLKPEQVMNRYVRGVLTGLRNIGVDGFYPGRDAVTAGRRDLAICSFETDSSGALLFETVIAVERGLETLAYDLDLLDSNGILTSPMYSAETVTALARELGHNLPAEQLARTIEAGYETLMTQVTRRQLTAEERSQAKSRGNALAARGWLTDRRPDPSLTLVGRERIQLGFAEAHLAVDAAGIIERIKMAGDLIANSGGLAEFERELIGKRLDLVSVSAAVAKIYANGANYILGAGDLTNISRIIMKAS